MAATRLVSIDFDVNDLRVTACHWCRCWYAELACLDGLTVMREWHETDCPIARELASADSFEHDSTIDLDAQVQRAIGVVMAVYAMDAPAASQTLRLRAQLVSMSLEDLAAQVLERARDLRVGGAVRRRASDLFDEIGA